MTNNPTWDMPVAHPVHAVKIGPDLEIDPNVIVPAHYGGREDPYEVFKVIRAWEVNFFLGNALKYIRRAGKKDPSKHIEDLEKAKEYIQSEIDHLKSLA